MRVSRSTRWIFAHRASGNTSARRPSASVSRGNPSPGHEWGWMARALHPLADRYHLEHCGLGTKSFIREALPLPNQAFSSPPRHSFRFSPRVVAGTVETDARGRVRTQAGLGPRERHGQTTTVNRQLPRRGFERGHCEDQRRSHVSGSYARRTEYGFGADLR